MQSIETEMEEDEKEQSKRLTSNDPLNYFDSKEIQEKYRKHYQLRGFEREEDATPEEIKAAALEAAQENKGRSVIDAEVLHDIKALVAEIKKRQSN